MSAIQKAFDMLSKELGDNFKFKDIDEFKDAITSQAAKEQEVVDFIKNLHTNAAYIDFTASYDTINRRNKLHGDYQILNDADVVLDTDDTLRVKNFEVHSKILDYIENVMLTYVEVPELKDEYKYRFDLETLDCEELEED